MSLATRQEKTELLALLEEKHRRLAKTRLVDYCGYIEIPGVPLQGDDDDENACEEFYPDTVTPAAHHILTLDALQRMMVGEIKRLMIFMPPGSAKSTYASVVFPTFFMGTFPRTNVIHATYASGLAQKFGRKCRQITRSKQFGALFDTQLVADNRAADDWSLENGSTYMCGGILSGITGNRADLLVVDDPMKGREAADSPTIREKTWEAYKSDLRTRLKPKGLQLIIQTRWHPEDLAGQILPESYDGRSGWVTSRTGEEWYVINLPAQCEREDDPLGRQVGEYLWTDWFPVAFWENEKTVQGSRNWSALYQQRPAPEGGSIFQLPWFKRFREYVAKPDFIVQSWDTASKPKEHNDPSVGTTWFVTRDGYQLVDLIRVRQEYPDFKRTIINAAEKWHPTHILIEDKSSGQALLQDIKRDTRLPVLPIMPIQDKATRARAESAAVERGLVAIPEQASWLNDFERELMLFPNAGHDDQVDSMVQFLAWIKTKQTQALPQIWAS